MLILTRKAGETILIGDNIKIMVTRIHGNQVRIGIEAPKDINIRRKEVAETPPVTKESKT